MTTDLAGFTAKVGQTVTELQKAQRRGVDKAALAVTNTIRGEIRAATGGDMRLSGVGRAGARVGARYDVKGTKNPTALIRATGPIQLIERDTSPHTIIPRGRRVSKRTGRRLRGKKALFFDGRFASLVVHPGTKGKHPFKRGVAKGLPKAPPEFRKQVGIAVRRVWG